MNILVSNWTWYPSGGDWTYIDNLNRLYMEHGHQVVPFAMQDERNFFSDYSSYFIEKIDYKRLNSRNRLTNGFQVLTKSMYSWEAKKNLEKLLDEVRIDLAHLHLIHHYITPSILKVLKKRGIPVIWTLHDYTPICPQSTFISNDKVCEKCKGGRFYQCAINKCKKRSFMASSVAALGNYLDHYLDCYADVAYFICPSKFSYEKYKSHGFFCDKLVQLYHGYTIDGPLLEAKATVPGKKHILYVGRLEKIKGVLTLLKAMKMLPDIHLDLIGDGAYEEELKTYTIQNNLANVSFLGKKDKKEVWSSIQQAAFLVCPSEWYEVLGFTIVEGMLLGKPVIGAAIGAIPETVIDGYSGFLFEPGNVETLAGKIKALYEDEKLIAEMGENARCHATALFNPQKHFEGLQQLIPSL